MHGSSRQHKREYYVIALARIQSEKVLVTLTESLPRDDYAKVHWCPQIAKFELNILKLTTIPEHKTLTSGLFSFCGRACFQGLQSSYQIHGPLMSIYEYICKLMPPDMHVPDHFK